MTVNHSLKNISYGVLFAVVFVLVGSSAVYSQTTSQLLLPLSKQPETKSVAADKENSKKLSGVDFCLYQDKHVTGVTDPKGIQLSEVGPLNYVLLKPAFTLTAKHVKNCELKETPQPSVSDLDYMTLSIEFSNRGRTAMYEAFKDIAPVSFVMVVNGQAFPVRIAFRARSVQETSEEISLGYFVDRDFAHRFLDVLNPLGTPTSQERSKQLYFPTAVGTKRVIQSTSGEGEISEFTETISNAEEKDGKYIVAVNRETPKSKAGYGERLSKYEYEVSSNGLFNLSNDADGKLTEPEPLLKLPAKVADMWTHEHFDTKQAVTRTGDFTVWGQQVVEVPAGRFKAIPVHRQYVWKRNGEQVAKSKSTTWYAIGVGVVRHVLDHDGEKTVTVLKEFTRGKVK